jgi:hypothetical protein
MTMLKQMTAEYLFRRTQGQRRKEAILRRAHQDGRVEDAKKAAFELYRDFAGLYGAARVRRAPQMRLVLQYLDRWMPVNEAHGGKQVHGYIIDV